MKLKTKQYLTISLLAFGPNLFGFDLTGGLKENLDPSKAVKNMADAKMAQAKGKLAAKAGGAVDKASSKINGKTEAVTGKAAAVGGLFQKGE
jgi:uncharacterized protein YjbJ (UPF0337 family)